MRVIQRVSSEGWAATLDLCLRPAQAIKQFRICMTLVLASTRRFGSSCPARSQACADRVNLSALPGIHVFCSKSEQGVDGRDIGERKRRRSSNGYARP